MIQKTPEEKAAIKAAKKAYKQNGYNRLTVISQQKQPDSEPKRNYILTGLMDGENVLPNDYPVYWDFLYVADQKDGTQKVVLSPIKATVKELKDDIFKLTGFRPVNIYNCKTEARNIL